jgi:hypothetical protein
MRAQTTAILCLGSWFVLLWAGCCRGQGGLPCASVKFGGACGRDADCRSGLCDRGICADERDFGVWNYGLQCEPGYAPHPLEDRRFPVNMDPCGGYVCVDRRCRSCQSDAECQTGSSDYKCLHYDELPGSMRCGDPDELLRNPGAPRPGPTHEIAPEDIVPSVPPRVRPEDLPPNYGQPR